MNTHDYTLARAYGEVASQASHIFHSRSELTLDDRAELHSWASEHLPMLEEELHRRALPVETVARHLAHEAHASKYT